MNAEQKCIYEYLKESVRNGRRYFRARHMAKDLALSPKCIGTNLQKMSRFCKDLAIQRWARSVSVTWYVTTVTV